MIGYIKTQIIKYYTCIDLGIIIGRIHGDSHFSKV